MAVGGVAASGREDRGATAWESVPGTQLLLDSQPDQSYVNANAILDVTTETAESLDQPQMTYSRWSREMPQPHSPRLPLTCPSTVGDRCPFGYNANGTFGEQSSTSTEAADDWSGARYGGRPSAAESN